MRRRGRDQVASFYLGGRLRHVKRRETTGMFRDSREARFLWCPRGAPPSRIELSIWEPHWDKPPKWWAPGVRVKLEVRI